jgi:uncharacterized protein YllA (UPF0747 family)
LKLHEKIPLSKSGLISPIVSDYLQSDSFLKDFYHFSPNDKGIEEAIYSRKFAKENRTILVHTLQNDYKVLGINDSIAQKQMELLKQENTFTVTTGHQLCVFGGPLFLFYKIASTIKLAQELSQKYPDKNFIPFFWLASEDHDFEEVNHLYYKQEKYTWQQNTNSFPVGKLLLRESFHDFFNAIKKATQGAYFEEDFAKKIFDAYATSETLAEATIKLVHAVFGDLGLLCIDADNKQFKKALVPVMLKDILEQQCYNSLKETNTILKKKYKAQINGRER